MGKAGKLKKRAGAASTRLENLKKKIKDIAGDEAQIKKRKPVGNLAMEAILEEINRQLEMPTSPSDILPTSTRTTHGSLANIRSLIDKYKQIENMMKSFDELPDDDPQETQAIEKIEEELTELEKQTGLAKAQPGLSEAEIVKRNVLARIDRLKDDVEALEREIALPDNQFENPAVKLKGAIERAKTKIAQNRALAALNKTGESDDEKERAILRWEIEINKIEKQIKDILAVAQREPSTSELNVYITEYQMKLSNAKAILNKVKGDDYPVYLAERDSIPIRSVLSEFNLPKIMQKAAKIVQDAGSTQTPEGQAPSGVDVSVSANTGDSNTSLNIDDAFSDVFELDDTSPLNERRKLILESVAKLSKSGEFDAISVALFAPLVSYKKNIPNIFKDEYAALGSKLSNFLDACESVPISFSADEVPQNIKEAYRELVEEVPDEFKELFPATLGKQQQNMAKSTSTQSDTHQTATETLSEDQKDWLKLFAEAAKSITDHPTLLSYEFLSTPDVDCKNAFTGDVANLGILAQAFYEACEKVPGGDTHPEFKTKIEEVKKAYNLFIEALPQPLRSEFKFPEKFEADTLRATSKTSSTVSAQTKVKSPYITLDGSHKLLFEQLKEELKKPNPNINEIDDLIDKLRANQFANEHDLADKLSDLQVDFVEALLKNTTVAPEKFEALSRYIESLPIIEGAPILNTPFNPDNIQTAIELQTLLSSENTLTDRMKVLAQNLLDDDSFIQKNGADHPLRLKLNSLIRADATTEKKQIDDTSDLLAQWVQKSQRPQVLPDPTRTQEIERLRATVERLHQEASSLLDEPNHKLGTIQTLLAGKSESQQRETLERIDVCKVKLESLRTRLSEVGKMDDIDERSTAYVEVMRNTDELSKQIAGIEAGLRTVVKKTNRVDTDEADLREHPAVIKRADPAAQITIGDMHGNTMKLIHFLIQQGVMKLESPEQYAELRDIYAIFNDANAYKPEVKDNLKSLLTAFQNIVSRAKIIDPAPTIRLIGDELADRGANDYLTLKVLEKLSKAGTNVEILMSNHSMEFLAPIEIGIEAGKEGVTNFNNLGGQQGQSGVNLYRLLELGVIDFAEVQELVNNHYKKFTRALSYTLSEDNKEITIFSHAAIGMTQLVDIAKTLGIQNVKEPESAVEIAKLIDVIADEMMKRVLNNTLNEFKISEGDLKGRYKPEYSALEFLFWNREYAPDLIDRKPTLTNGDKCNWAHGHDSDDPLHVQKKPHIKMLDSYFGKSWRDPFLTTSDQMQNPVLTTYGTSPKLALAMTQEQIARQEQERIAKLERERTEAKDLDKVGVRTTIESTKNLNDLLAFIKVTDDAFAGLGNDDCRAAMQKLGHVTELDVDELKEFLAFARKQAFTLATDKALSTIADSDDHENLMKLLLCDPRALTNNDFKDALSKLVDDKVVMDTLTSDMGELDIDKLIQATQNVMRDEIVQQAIEAIKKKASEGDIEQNAKYEDLLDDDLLARLKAVAPTDNDLRKLSDTTRLSSAKNLAALVTINELNEKIAAIKIESSEDRKNIRLLLQAGASLSNPECRNALATLLKKNPTDQEDPQIQQIIDAKMDLQWMNESITQVFTEYVEAQAYEGIEQNIEGNLATAKLLSEFIKAPDDANLSAKLIPILGQEHVTDLIATKVDLIALKGAAVNRLGEIALEAAANAVQRLPLSDLASNPNNLINFIKSATSVPPAADKFDKLKAIIAPSEVVDHLIAANVTDLREITEAAQIKLREITENKLLAKLNAVSDEKLVALISEATNLHGIAHPGLQKAINDIAGIPNFHEQIQLIGPANIRPLITKISESAVRARTTNAQKRMLQHVIAISDITVLEKLRALDKNQTIDDTQINKLTNLFGSKASDFLPALLSANPKLKFNIFVDAAKQRIASLDAIKLQQNIGLFQGNRAVMMQLHKASNLEERLSILVTSGIIPSASVPQLKKIDESILLNAINDSAKQWITDNLVKSAKTIIDGIKEIDKLPVINTQADLAKLGFTSEQQSYFSDPSDLKRIKDAITERKETIELTASTPSKSVAQLRDVREFISNRATIQDLEALQKAVLADDEAKCQKVLKRRGFTDESLSELKIADFKNLTALISSQLHEMQLQDTAAVSAKNNFERCSAVLEDTIRDRDELQRQVDEQTEILTNDDADQDAKNQAQEELDELEPLLATVQSKVTIAREDLNHARERLETADTIDRDKKTKLHQAELVHLQDQSKQAETRVEDRKKLVKASENAGVVETRVASLETDAKRLLEEAKAPKRTDESDDEYAARQAKISDLTTIHAQRERELSDVKRVKTEADRVLTEARALKSDDALRTDFDAAKETVAVHLNQKPPQISDEPKKKAKRLLQEDDTINENAARTDLAERKHEAEEALSKATKRESKLIARKAELEDILANNPSHGINQAAKTELTQLQTALEAVRKQINAEEALIAGTTPTATKEARKKLEVEAKHTADEANTCMRDYKQAQKYTKDKISIAKHVRDNYMGNQQMLVSLEKLSDNYVVQIQYHAKRGHDENAKEELNAILDKSAKLHAQLEIFKDELNKEILSAVANKEDLLKMLEKVNAILMAIEQAQRAYHVPLAEVGSLCKISNPPICSTEDEINNQIAAIIGAAPGTATGTLSSGPAKINTTATFKDAAGRVTTMELEDGRALRKGTFNAAVVQKCTPEGGFVTIFHVKESDKSRITGNTSLTAGAKLIEEHRLGNHNSSDPIDIIGKFPPQMVKDMIAYCEAKGYKYNNLTDTKYTPSAKSISALQEKLDTDKMKVAVFGTAKELGTSKAKITALEKEIKLDETPTPTSTRPST